MVEREPQHETVGRGELFFLDYPATEGSISGYGLAIEAGRKRGSLPAKKSSAKNPRFVDVQALKCINHRILLCQESEYSFRKSKFGFSNWQ